MSSTRTRSLSGIMSNETGAIEIGTAAVQWLLCGPALQHRSDLPDAALYPSWPRRSVRWSQCPAGGRSGAAAASSASAAASACYADVLGRLGDPGDRRLSGASAAASAAGSSSGTRPVRLVTANEGGAARSAAPFFLTGDAVRTRAKCDQSGIIAVVERLQVMLEAFRLSDPRG